MAKKLCIDSSHNRSKFLSVMFRILYKNLGSNRKDRI